MSSRLQQFAQAEPTIDSVLGWHDMLVEEQLLNPVQARLRKTAIAQLWKERDSNARDDATWLLANLDALTQQLLDKGTRAATATTYKSRAVAALRDYVDYRARPQELRASKRGAPRRRGRPQQPELKSFELSPGRVFRYEVPQGGLGRRDVERIYLHLMALVPDINAADARRSVQRAFDFDPEMHSSRREDS